MSLTFLEAWRLGSAQSGPRRGASCLSRGPVDFDFGLDRVLDGIEVLVESRR